MADYSKEFLEYTIKTWQPHSLEPLSLEDAHEIANNMVELFIYLNELKQKYDKKETNV